MIDIEFKAHNRTKDFFRKLYNKLEDIAFSIILKLPNRLTPCWLLNWFNNYADRRIQNLNQQIIKNNWEKAALEKALSDIYSQQRKEKAPSDD